MKILIDYTGDIKGFNLESKIEIDIEKDAEALGYFLCVTSSVHGLIEALVKNSDPKYAKRIAIGALKATQEAEQEQSDIWPFQNFRFDN